MGFTFWGRLVNFVMVICAQAVVAIPTAITVAGFMKQIEGDDDDDEDDGDDDGEGADVSGEDGSFLGRLHSFLGGKSSLAARVFEYSIATLIVLNIIAVILESIDTVRPSVCTIGIRAAVTAAACAGADGARGIAAQRPYAAGPSL